MQNSTISSENGFFQDQEVWESLKQAIASSSGFARWQKEQIDEKQLQRTNLDQQVRYYLRETLETLAY